jgi:AraC-like DNA-binding protein
MDTKILRHSSEDVLFYPEIEVNSFDELYMQKVAQKTIYNYHRASFYHIFRYQGEGNYHYIKNRKIKVENGSLLIVNRDILQRYSRHKCKGDMVLFSFAFFTRTESKTDFLTQCTLLKNDYIIIPPGSESFQSSVELYFSLIKTQLKNEKIRQTDLGLMCNWLHNLLIVIEREYRLQKRQISSTIDFHNYMQQFKDLLDIHYQTEKSVHFYAEKLHLSDKKLSQMVSAEHGISAKEYISEKIMQTAVRLLENTTLNQSEIAIELGLDSTYFIKFFRKHFGITPAKYKKSKRTAISHQ